MIVREGAPALPVASGFNALQPSCSGTRSIFHIPMSAIACEEVDMRCVRYGFSAAWLKVFAIHSQRAYENAASAPSVIK